MVGRGEVDLVSNSARFHKAAGHLRADPFHAAARQHPLVRHVKQAVLEAGAAEIGDQDFHGAFKNSYCLTARFPKPSIKLAIVPRIPRAMSTALTMTTVFAFCFAVGSWKVTKPTMPRIVKIAKTLQQRVKTTSRKTLVLAKNPSNPDSCRGD